MKLHLLFFLPAALASWNCAVSTGTGDYGRCLEDGNEDTAAACGIDHPCRVQGNGCVPLGARTANCS
ncbi:hypothetical protein FDECE_18355 [Fusarium decemcellulare]|nr:hypothetical protein FDECE_18355 [Fusarium decemcellulare]